MSSTAFRVSSVPSTGTTSPARTTISSPASTCSTGTCSSSSSATRCASLGARATSAVSSRRARLDAASSSAAPPENMSPTIAPASSSSNAREPTIATSAIVSTPRWWSTRTVWATSAASSSDSRIDCRAPDLIAGRGLTGEVEQAPAQDRDERDGGEDPAPLLEDATDEPADGARLPARARAAGAIRGAAGASALQRRPVLRWPSLGQRYRTSGTIIARSALSDARRLTMPADGAAERKRVPAGEAGR